MILLTNNIKEGRESMYNSKGKEQSILRIWKKAAMPQLGLKLGLQAYAPDVLPSSYQDQLFFWSE